MSRTGVSNGYKGTGMNGGRGVNGGLIKRELPEPPNLPPPDYNETMAARSKVSRILQDHWVYIFIIYSIYRVFLKKCFYISFRDR